MKKIVSLLLLLFTLVFTMGATSFATTNMGIEDFEITTEIGGGPSGAWEYETNFYHSFSYTEVKKMSGDIQDVMVSTKYEAGEIAYDTSLIAVGFMGYGIGSVPSIYQRYFGSSYFDEIQDSANSLATATANHSEGDNILLKVTKYHRPASGETIFIMDYKK